MLEVLKPFEVRAGDTTAVNKHVWAANDVTVVKDLFSSESSWAVSTFENSLNLNIMSVALVK